jgi:hypothetical protein
MRPAALCHFATLAKARNPSKATGRKRQLSPMKSILADGREINLPANSSELTMAYTWVLDLNQLDLVLIVLVFTVRIFGDLKGGVNMCSSFLVRPTTVSLILAICLLLPLNTFAQEGEVYIFGGDSCYVRNANSEVGKMMRKADGALKNTHEDIKATVYCPLPVKFPMEDLQSTVPTFAPMDVRIYFHNSHQFKQAFKCTSSTRRVEWPEPERDEDDDGDITVIGATLNGYIKLDVSAITLGSLNGTLFPIVMCEQPPLSEIYSVVVAISASPLP